MEFGYTIPLQRHLKIKLPPPQTASAPFFCWYVHLLTIQKRRTALAMNRASRYCILLYGMRAADWVHLPVNCTQDYGRGQGKKQRRTLKVDRNKRKNKGFRTRVCSEGRAV